MISTVKETHVATIPGFEEDTTTYLICSEPKRRYSLLKVEDYPSMKGQLVNTQRVAYLGTGWTLTKCRATISGCEPFSRVRVYQHRVVSR
jgi:hypothetical protein